MKIRIEDVICKVSLTRNHGTTGYIYFSIMYIPSSHGFCSDITFFFFLTNEILLVWKLVKM